MKIVCIHCGAEFSIRAQDLGGKGVCPHCKGEISLPKPEAAEAEESHRRVPSNWLENSFSGMASLVIHLVLFLLIALLQMQGGTDGVGEGEEVQIGVLPANELSEVQESQLSVDEVQKEQTADQMELVDVEVTSASAAEATSGDFALSTPSPSGGESGSFDLGTAQAGGGSMGGGGSFEGLISNLRKSGLDIVLCFDSTGSMAGEIDQVKRQIERIGTTLTRLVPKARISICTYRDIDDEYVAKGLPLSSSIQDVSDYLSQVSAGGGGDHPEAVDEGLAWSTGKNSFRPTARKVILLFGDAPPHPQKLARCLQVASQFRSQNKGIVSTVTCHSDEPLEEFVEIAQAGGGEAFTSADQRQIMTQLMVLVFGSRHREKVIEAFKLLDE